MAAVGSVEQSTLVPGALVRGPVESRQFGAAMESDIGAPESALGAGFDAGFASGDPAPGFGVADRAGAAAPKPGDLDGPQAAPPRDNRIDNFRFSPDYHIDRILFREIIGTVTDAVYVRPHARWRFLDVGPASFSADAALTASWAVEAASAPGQVHPLGVELDPSLVYDSGDGFNVALEYAVLFPMAGLDNPAQNLSARPAQLARLRAMFIF